MRGLDSKKLFEQYPESFETVTLHQPSEQVYRRTVVPWERTAMGRAVGNGRSRRRTDVVV